MNDGGQVLQTYLPDHPNGDDLARRYTERVKELNCLYGIFKIITRPSLTLDGTLQAIVDMIPHSWLHTDEACARITLGDSSYVTDNFSESAWKQGAKIMVGDEQAGVVEVFYLEEKPPADEGPFLAEEWYLINAVGEQIGMIVMQHRAKQAFKASEKNYRNLVESVNDWMWEVDHNGKYTFCSPQIKELLGYGPEEVIGKTPFDLMPESEARRVAGIFAAVAKDQSSFSGLENINLHKDGHHVVLETSGTPVFDDNEELIGFRGVDRDITVRKKTEREMHKIQDRLLAAANEWRATFDAISDMVFMLDTDYTIKRCNKAFARAVGLEPAAIVGKKCYELLHGLDRPFAACACHTTIKEARAATVEVDDPNIGIPLLITTSPILDKEGTVTGVVHLAKDISERKKMMDELVKTSKLDSIGTLAGGIAHDFNNLLTGIIGNVSLAKMDAEPDSELYEMLDDAEQASLKAQNLTQQLLTFSRGGRPVRKVVGVDSFLESAVKLGMRETGVGYDVQIGSGSWPVEADIGQMGQAIRNLVLNAAQAHPSDNMVRVRADNVVFKEKEDPDLAAGHYVKITIADKGSGIPEENKHLIFDPFFSTRAGASGLGLSTAYSIVKGHNGKITAESAPGEGTVMSIFLPAAAAAGSKSGDQTAGTEQSHPSQAYRILVMDDEKIVRKLVGRILKMAGHEVVFAVDGDQAIDCYIDAGAEGKYFDAVIMDLTIPGGMGGKEAIEKLRQIDPGITAIASSGYSNDPVMSDYKTYGFSGVVTKPYKASTLTEALEELIENRKAAEQ